MKPVVFDTCSLPPPLQFEAWKEWYGPVFDASPQRPAREGYAVRHVTWRLDGFAISQTAAPPVRSSRTKAHVRRNAIDHWVITLTRRGGYRISAQGIVSEPNVGVPLIQSLADPMECESDGCDRVQLYLARDDFDEIATILDAARNIPLDTPSGKLLAEYLALLERSLSTLQRDHMPVIKSAMKAMVSACVSPSRDRLAQADGPIIVSRMELVRRAVKKYLRVPTLDLKLLCTEVGMSRSTLYRLLGGEGGVSQYIQRLRLAAAYSTLADVTNKKSSSEIAFEFCFSDLSTFSRVFRREFGLSPSDVRSAAVTGLMPMAAPSSRAKVAPANFGDLIRHI